MAQSAPFIILVAALLINTLLSCSASNVYCVTPTQPMAVTQPPCPSNSIHTALLSEYAHKTELYFTSNTTMVFLPGDHSLQTNITVVNVTRLTMRGESYLGKAATVVRNGSVGFSFTNMVDFNIYSLLFTSYNWSLNYNGSCPSSNSALLLQFTRNAKLINCSFQNNLGTALVVNNTSINLEENNEFLHNQCGCEPFSMVSTLGCGITALNSNLTFTGNTNFFGNNASFRYSTGAIWASTSSLYFTGNNNFIGNSAKHNGGAIHAENDTSLIFKGANNFHHNSADYGGAIYTNSKVVVTFTGTNNFINNTAYYHGGAIFSVSGYIERSVIAFYGSNNFTGNSANNGGGAISAKFSKSLSFTGISRFSSNSAIQGGAIYAFHSSLAFNGSISFTNNGDRNSLGGAIYLALSSTFSILHHTTVCWEQNHARLGGAIYVKNVNSLVYCTMSHISKNTPKEECFFQLPESQDVQLVFENNSADTAGSVLYGGAIDNCKLTGWETFNSRHVLNKVVKYKVENTTSSVSSDPFCICPCDSKKSC